jgi:hypothetical protein
MNRNPEALNRELRQLMVLGFLRSQRSHARAKEVKDAFYFAYPGTTEVAIHRRFRDDMEDLRRAGLINFVNLRSQTRISLAVPQKDARMYLTLGEHEALRFARERLGWKPAASPFNWDPGTQKLAYLVQALRFIEEGNTEVGDLAEALNVRPRKVQQILDRLDGVRPASELLADLVIERNAVNDRPQAALVPLGPIKRPLEGRGLDEIGLFAYSRDEVDDRISLIDRAMSDGGSEQDTDSLRSARKKLDAWRRRLEQLES